MAGFLPLSLEMGGGDPDVRRQVPAPRTPEVLPKSWESSYASRGPSLRGDDEAEAERYFGSCETAHTRSSGDLHSVGSNDRAADQIAQSLPAGSNTYAEHASWVGAPKGSLQRGQSVASFSTASISVFDEVRGKSAGEAVA
jgi:hypothetical protein